MKQLLLAALITTTAAAANAADVGVSISVGDPNFYGQITLGNYPPPALINPQPVIIERAPVSGPPIYLRAPAGHIKRWKKYCHRYNACNRQVYFVQDHWYKNEYVPRYQAEHHHDHHHDRHDKKQREHHDHRDDYRDR